jgi:hypothetical protein
MEEFASKTVQRGTYIDHDGGLAFTDAPYVQVARWDAPLASWKRSRTPPIAMPPVVVTTYKLRRRLEGRLFYNGRNRRYRELPATLEEA